MRRFLSILLVLIIAIGTLGLAPRSLSSQGQGATIRLKAATFTPTRGESPKIAPGLNAYMLSLRDRWFGR